MRLFTPRSLDASICDVITKLSDLQKADVLLHALQHVPIQRSCRTVIENAVQSLLQITNLPSANIARALLLRAKGRFAAGHRTSAQQDLHSASMVDPENEDVGAVDIQLQHLRSILGTPAPGKKQDGRPHIAEEIWQRIALLLPRHELKSLLLVSKSFSRIASEVLSREIDLHLTTAMEPGEALGSFSPTAEGNVDRNFEAWHHQRNADLLTRILVDAHFATQVRSLEIFAFSPNVEPHLAFKVGMLMNALPKLFNLRKVYCIGNKELILRLLQMLHSYNPSLERLSLVVTDNGVDITVPAFKHLTHFMVRSDGGNNLLVPALLGRTRDTLCGLSIRNASWHFPSKAISLWSLTQIEFKGCSLGEALLEILNNSHQLESLILSGILQSSTSSFIRQNSDALPLLGHFSLTITNAQIEDPEFCPAIFEFLQERTQLRTCQLFVLEAWPSRIGFDASAWASLPALYGLHDLSITYPGDLPLVMAGLLVPRTVHALTLDLWCMDTRSPTFFDQLGKGMPHDLRYVCIIDRRMNHSVQNVVERGFPGVRVVRINGTVWTVTKSGDGNLEMEQWSSRRARYREAEWLESLGCRDAIWTGVDE